MQLLIYPPLRSAPFPAEERSNHEPFKYVFHYSTDLRCGASFHIPIRLYNAPFTGHHLDNFLCLQICCTEEALSAYFRYRSSYIPAAVGIREQNSFSKLNL